MSDHDSDSISSSSMENESDISEFSSEFDTSDSYQEGDDQYVDQINDDYLAIDDLLDSDENNAALQIQRVINRLVMNLNEEDNNSDSFEERPLESELRNDYNQHFDYLTNMIQTDVDYTVNDFSTNPDLSLPAFGTHKACIIPLREIIPLPGDQIPYVTSNPSMVILLLQLLGIHQHSEESQLIPCLAGIHVSPEEDAVELAYGCTVTIQKAYFNEHLFSIGVVFTCKSRCKITSYSLSSTYVITGNVQLFEDPIEQSQDYPPLPVKSSSLFLLPVIGKTALNPNFTQQSETTIQQTCISILRAYNDQFSIISDAAILRQVPSDTLELSYFLCNQMLINYDEELQLFLSETAEQRIQLAGKFCRTTTVIRCKCGNRLHRFVSSQRLNLFGGNCNKSVFVNRYGNSFRVITTRSLINYLEVTRPSGEDTWFPGYKWQILECSHCQEHIGWKFIAEENAGLQKFFAISQSSIDFSEGWCVCLQT